MRAPVVAVGDGALGFWAAIREVFPDTSFTFRRYAQASISFE